MRVATSIASSPAKRSRLQRGFAFTLMTTAGWCDAAGFMLFAQLYVSFMSGDATQLGLQLGEGHWSAAAKFLAAQMLFVFGAGLGRFLRLGHPTHGRRLILAANVLLLGSTALVGSHVLGIPAFVMAVVAMGLQNAVMTHEAGVPVGTMVTGTLARLGESIADRVRGRSGAVLDNFNQWLFFVVGAFGGTLAFSRLGAGSFWVPALVSALLLPLSLRLPPMIDEPIATLT